MNNRMRTGTVLTAGLLLLFVTGSINEAYAWGFRKKKSEKVANPAAVRKTRYDELVEKAKTYIGMFRIHQQENDWYFEIPDSLFGRDMLIINKVSGVPYELNDA